MSRWTKIFLGRFCWTDISSNNPATFREHSNNRAPFLCKQYSKPTSTNADLISRPIAINTRGTKRYQASLHNHPLTLHFPSKGSRGIARSTEESRIIPRIMPWGTKRERTKEREREATKRSRNRARVSRRIKESRKNSFTAKKKKEKKNEKWKNEEKEKNRDRSDPGSQFSARVPRRHNGGGRATTASRTMFTIIWTKNLRAGRGASHP